MGFSRSLGSARVAASIAGDACSAERNLRTPCELPTVVLLRAGGSLNRRHFLQAAASLPLVSSGASGLVSAARAQTTAFDRSIVRQLARDAASKPYKAPDTKLPDNLKNLDYDHYRQIRFLPEHALWRDEKLAVSGAVLPSRLLLRAARRHLTKSRTARRQGLPTVPRIFPSAATRRRLPDTDLGFAGFRIHAPINRPDYYDEVCVFLGASYFRAVAKGQIYGLSARGLAINTGEAKGEEFPFFKTFWIEKPAAKPIPSSCMRCSTARARRRPIASRSGPATPRCSTSKWRSIRASISITPGSRR